MRKKQRKAKIFSLFLAVLLLSLTVLPVQAENGQAGITICYQGTAEGDTGETYYLSHMPVKLYHVGTSGVGGTLAEGFQDSGLSLEDLESLPSSQLQELAEKAADYARKEQVSGQEKETDDKGQVFFGGLSYGLYLIVPQSRYHVEAGSFLSSPFFVSLPMEGETDLSLNPKTQWADGVTIGLEELVVYTGGNELQEDNPDGFPKPRYTGIPKNVQWRVNGTLWEEEDYPFVAYYTRAEDDDGEIDSGVIAENDQIPGVYISHIRPVTEGAVITCSTDGFETEQKVLFTTSLLIVRNTNENKNEDQLGEIVSGSSPASQGLTQRQRSDLENGVGTVVIPDDSVITVNGKAELGTVEIEDSGLLFDELLYYGTQNAETGALVLEERAAKSLEDSGAVMEGRQYLSRYLDLVAYQDGNLWLSSSKGVDVYWPYPEGTDEDTEFTLMHFRGLHREYAIMGNADLEVQVQQAPMEQVEIENTGYGIQFHIPESGFSPFVLSWTSQQEPGKDPGKDPGKEPDKDPGTDQGKDKDSTDNPVKKVINRVKTGDPTPIFTLAVLVILSGGLFWRLGVKKRRSKR